MRTTRKQRKGLTSIGRKEEDAPEFVLLPKNIFGDEGGGGGETLPPTLSLSSSVAFTKRQTNKNKRITNDTRPKCDPIKSPYYSGNHLSRNCTKDATVFRLKSKTFLERTED